MNLPSLCARRALCVSTTFFCVSALAQTSPDLEDDTLELDPFVIDVSSDSGYYASQTMAGGRLNQSIKDTGSAIQVITAEFMDDIGATNMGELLQYTTSSEVAGILGNFTGSENQGQGDYSTEEARRDPDGATRIRGIAAPDRTRNFFLTEIPYDNYNSGRIDINRGANSFLFGLGTPAGVINNDLARATFRDSNEVNFRIGTGGDNPSYRANFKLNRVLIDDKLAILVAGLADRTEYRQRPTFEDDDRIYATLKFRPFGNSKTVFDAHFEAGETVGNAPDVLLPLHNLNTFLDGGVGIDYGDDYEPISASDAALIARLRLDVYANIRKYKDLQAPGYRNLPDPDSLTGAPGWFNSALGLVYDGTNGREPAFGYTARIRNSDLDKGNPFWDPENNNSTGPVNLYHNNLGKVGPSGWENQGFTDLDTFDFSKYNLGWDNDYYTRKFSNHNFTLQQTLWDGKAGFELAYDYQDIYKTNYTAFNGSNSQIMFDINETLFLPNQAFVDAGKAGNPDDPTAAGAQINPNIGRPFVITDSGRRTEDIQREAFRFTGFARFNFADTGMNDKLAQVLGNHTVTLLADKSTADENWVKWTYAPYGTEASYDPGEGIGPDNARFVGNAARKVPQMVYLGPQQLSAFTDPSFSLNDFQIHPATYQLERPDGYQIDRWVWDADDLQWEYTTIEHHEVPDKNHRLKRDEVTSFAMNTQSKFLDNHVVLNMGYREDTIDNWLNTKARIIGEGTANPDIDETPDISPTGWSLDDTERTRYKQFKSSVFGYGGVVYLPKDIIPMPSWVDDISLHYNSSENFVPATERIDQFANPIPAPTGNSKDWGISMYLLESKFIAKFNWYEGKLENDVASVTRVFPKSYFSYFTHYSNFNSQLVTYLKKEYKYNPTTGATPGFDSYDAMLADAASNHAYLQDHLDALASLETLLVPELIENWKFSLTDDGNVNYEVAGDVTDTVTVEAKGFEAEFIFNPTKNWRIAFNAARQQTVMTDVAPRLTDFIGDFWEGHLAKFGDLRWNGRLDQENGQLVRDQLNDKLVEYYIAKAQEGQTNGEQREWRFNLITHYAFSDGRFKGFGVGGAYRWQDGYDAGYQLMKLANGFTVPDANNAYQAKPEQAVDLFLNYSRKIFNDKVKWKVQLNVKNIQNLHSDDVTIVRYQPDGTAARARFAPPLEIVLSNNFKF